MFQLKLPLLCCHQNLTRVHFVSKVIYLLIFAGEAHIEDMERAFLSGLSWQCRAPNCIIVNIGQTVLYLYHLIFPHADTPDADEIWTSLQMNDMIKVQSWSCETINFSTQLSKHHHCCTRSNISTHVIRNFNNIARSNKTRQWRYVVKKYSFVS